MVDVFYVIIENLFRILEEESCLFLNFGKINSEDFVFFMRVLHQFFCLTKEMMARLALVNEPMWPKKPIETSSPSREYCILLIFGS